MTIVQSFLIGCDENIGKGQIFNIQVKLDVSVKCTPKSNLNENFGNIKAG